MNVKELIEKLEKYTPYPLDIEVKFGYISELGDQLYYDINDMVIMQDEFYDSKTKTSCVKECLVLEE